MANQLSQFGGEELFEVAPERVFDVLTDLDTLAATIPDLVNSERPDRQTLKCVVKPRLSFLTASLKLTVRLSDVEPPRAAVMHIVGQGIGVSLEISSSLAIEAHGNGSRLRWTARIERAGGLMATVPAGLIKGAADQVIRQGWQQVRERLAEDAKKQ
jgi:carbon monoxide dehydrogenase subunit G